MVMWRMEPDVQKKTMMFALEENAFKLAVMVNFMVQQFTTLVECAEEPIVRVDQLISAIILGLKTGGRIWR